MRVLVVTAVRAEADSVIAGLSPGGPVTTHRVPGGDTLLRCAGAGAGTGAGTGTGRSAETGATVDVLAGGAGPAAAAAAAATVLTAAATGPGAPGYDLVVSAGIGGGFAGAAPLGSIVVADAIVAADLGAQTPDGHLTLEELGFGRSAHRPAALSKRIAESLAAVHAPVLTVSTVTGTAGRAAELTARHPRAAAEAMEGFGVAEAAVRHGVPVAEIRAVSNAVGPRDRASWRIGEALEALREAFRLLSPVLEEEAR
ncbi:futalosine hydrolase [Streptomyces spongiicola]|uniref:Futalosine hydrolase n=1 Tax=Streptomyces spongiicola TaxID=1690221 RepID=A0A388T400_9ACTN|nr:futalosine hydrolase [Streptomyces spongiicola]GBQ03256.1 futalosine hydrolase [Streptomyces spongiicola]